MTDADIRDLLLNPRRIAVVGASDRPGRPSHEVFGFLRERGYDAVPVNPALEGRAVQGVASVASLAEAAPLDMVDIFRRSDAVPAIVEEAVACLPHLRTIWMQLGVTHPHAANHARAQGLTVIEDRCPKIEFPRYR